MAGKTQRTDFHLSPLWHGVYEVEYISPTTSKRWLAVLTDAPLIDAVFHEDFPRRKDLDALKRKVKSNNKKAI